MVEVGEERQDPLGVLATTREVVARARHVWIDRAAVERAAEALAGREIPVPEWDRALHWEGGREETANYVLVLDALNFCFWGEPRWRVAYRGQRYDGYWALAAALRHALEAGVPLYDAAFLAGVSRDEVAEILRGEHEIPLLDARVHNLREVGRGLLERSAGQFSRMIEAAGRSAAALIRQVIVTFPSFDDVALYDGAVVRFYKRAQILASDLAGAFRGRDLGAFDDLSSLTAFADYKVPQVLRGLGILAYAPDLARVVDAREEIPAGDPREVEIRAGTIWAVEEIRRAVARRGRALTAAEIDWALWDLGQRLPAGTPPYHRTRTIFY